LYNFSLIRNIEQGDMAEIQNKQRESKDKIFPENQRSK